MNSLTLLVCIVAVAVIPVVFSGKDDSPPKDTDFDTAERTEASSSFGGPEDDPPSTGALSKRKGCFIVYTLTSRGPYSGTDALFSLQFWKKVGYKCSPGLVPDWESSKFQLTNNPLDDREEMHWDLYGPYDGGPSGIGGLPADWIRVRQTTRPYDRWQIKTIFVKDTCKKIVYEYYCDGCWVSTDPKGGTWFKRTA